MSEVAVLTGIYGTEQTAMRGYDGRFIGARVNLDSLPPLPASVVAYALAEARGLTLRWPPHFDDAPGEAATLHVPTRSAVVVRRASGWH